jgi:hypothetical protein
VGGQDLAGAGDGGDEAVGDGVALQAGDQIGDDLVPDGVRRG